MPVSVGQEGLGADSAQFKAHACNSERKREQNIYLNFPVTRFDGKRVDEVGQCAYQTSCESIFGWSQCEYRDSYKDDDGETQWVTRKHEYAIVEYYHRKSHGTLLAKFSPNYPGDDYFRSQGAVEENYAKYFYPTVAQGCRSSICLGMRAGDLIFALSLLNSTINVNRTIQLAVTPKSNRSIGFNNVPFSAAWAVKMLARVDYPVSLPFDTE